MSSRELAFCVRQRLAHIIPREKAAVLASR